MSEKLKRSLGRWLNCFSHRWGDAPTDSYDEGFCNGAMHVLSIILKHLYRKEPCSDPLPVQQPPSVPYPMIKCKKCGTVIGDNGYGYCEPCYFGLPDTAKFYNSGRIEGFAAGYAQALADAKAAVAQLHIYGEAYQDREHNIIDMAIAAIAALEEK